MFFAYYEYWKILGSKCIVEKGKNFIKLIGDKYFNQRYILWYYCRLYECSKDNHK